MPNYVGTPDKQTNGTSHTSTSGPSPSTGESMLRGVVSAQHPTNVKSADLMSKCPPTDIPPPTTTKTTVDVQSTESSKSSPYCVIRPNIANSDGYNQLPKGHTQCASPPNYKKQTENHIKKN